MGVMIEARGLAFGWRADAPLGRDLDLTVAPGELVCLLGPNGGGKTTLLRTLSGLLAPLAGEVRLAGSPLAGLARAEIARRVAVVPQSHQVAFPFSVEEVVLMGRTSRLALLATPSRGDHVEVARRLEQLAIAHLARRPYNAISGGERQLVLFARALVQEPRAVILDEPTASLDFGNQLRVLQTMRDLARGGLAVLASTHDPDHAFLVADRAVLLGRGGVLAAGRPEAVITPDSLRALYGVEIDVVRGGDGRVACMARLA
jgi:iron complex transport system ATP-binding protein